jgi:hypothetical protein
MALNYDRAMQAMPFAIVNKAKLNKEDLQKGLKGLKKPTSDYRIVTQLGRKLHHRDGTCNPSKNQFG